MLIKGEVPKPDVKEYAFKRSIGWEEIRSVKEYMYPDDWEHNKGPKYFLRIDSNPEELLILGNYRSMVDHWAMFRNKYPLFVERND